jgi:hypothetical protein
MNKLVDGVLVPLTPDEVNEVSAMQQAAAAAALIPIPPDPIIVRLTALETAVGITTQQQTDAQTALIAAGPNVTNLVVPAPVIVASPAQPVVAVKGG